MLNDEEKLAFLSKINSKLLESNGITCYEFELFNQLKNELDDDYTLERNKKIGAENNSNEEKIENRITQEKIKASIERIISYIKDKKEYEFISDYFINEFDPSVNSHFIKNNSSSDIINHKESNISQSSFIDTDLDKIDENFLNLLANTSLTDINSINKLREEINKNKNVNISNKSSFGFKKNSGLDDIFLPEMKKVKSSNESKSNENIGLENKEQMDKELEEEINRQIFGYTKKMKESARNFGVQLRKDNQTLSNIENLQDKVNEKTNTQVKRLQNFNYNLKIGFCKLMLLIFTVVGSFFGTIFIMKIFPKLA
jgi:hypothetical protein